MYKYSLISAVIMTQDCLRQEKDFNVISVNNLIDILI